MSHQDKQFTRHPRIDGHWRDGKGHQVSIDMIKGIDRARDTLVGDIVTKAVEYHNALKAFKRYAFEEIDAFRALSAEQYDAVVGGEKGNVKLYTFDGEYCIQVAVQDRISFDERLHTAKTLVDECIIAWSEGADPKILAIIHDAFQVDKEGKIRTQDILSLRRLDITDERWVQAMNAISESIQVIDSCRYIRVYQRTGENNQYTQISLNITGV
ncbi:DUF3164 family protein [Providencia rettgeri]